MLLNCGVGEDSWVPWTARRFNQSIQKEISSEYSMEGLMLKLKLHSFGHMMQTADSFEKTLMLGKIEGRRRRGWQRMRWLDGITDSMDWFEQAPGVGWWTGKPGMLQSMVSQRLGHNWATELNWRLPQTVPKLQNTWGFVTSTLTLREKLKEIWLLIVQSVPYLFIFLAVFSTFLLVWIFCYWSLRSKYVMLWIFLEVVSLKRPYSFKLIQNLS